MEKDLEFCGEVYSRCDDETDTARGGMGRTVGYLAGLLLALALILY